MGNKEEINEHNDRQVERTLQRITAAEVKRKAKITIIGNIRRNMMIHIMQRKLTYLQMKTQEAIPRQLKHSQEDNHNGKRQLDKFKENRNGHVTNYNR